MGNFWDNNKDSIKSGITKVGKATYKGAKTVTKTTYKAGKKHYQESKERREAKEGKSHKSKKKSKKHNNDDSSSEYETDSDDSDYHSRSYGEYGRPSSSASFPMVNPASFPPPPLRPGQTQIGAGGVVVSASTTPISGTPQPAFTPASVQVPGQVPGQVLGQVPRQVPTPVGTPSYVQAQQQQQQQPYMQQPQAFGQPQTQNIPQQQPYIQQPQVFGQPQPQPQPQNIQPQPQVFGQPQPQSQPQPQVFGQPQPQSQPQPQPQPQVFGQPQPQPQPQSQPQPQVFGQPQPQSQPQPQVFGQPQPQAQNIQQQPQASQPGYGVPTYASAPQIPARQTTPSLVQPQPVPSAGVTALEPQPFHTPNVNPQVPTSVAEVPHFEVKPYNLGSFEQEKAEEHINIPQVDLSKFAPPPIHRDRGSTPASVPVSASGSTPNLTPHETAPVLPVNKSEEPVAAPPMTSQPVSTVTGSSVATNPGINQLPQETERQTAVLPPVSLPPRTASTAASAASGINTPIRPPTVSSFPERQNTVSSVANPPETPSENPTTFKTEEIPTSKYSVAGVYQEPTVNFAPPPKPYRPTEQRKHDTRSHGLGSHHTTKATASSTPPPPALPRRAPEDSSSATSPDGQEEVPTKKSEKEDQSDVIKPKVGTTTNFPPPPKPFRRTEEERTRESRRSSRRISDDSDETPPALPRRHQHDDEPEKSSTRRGHPVGLKQLPPEPVDVSPDEVERDKREILAESGSVKRVTSFSKSRAPPVPVKRFSSIRVGNSTEKLPTSSSSPTLAASSVTQKHAPPPVKPKPKDLANKILSAGQDITDKKEHGTGTTARPPPVKPKPKAWTSLPQKASTEDRIVEEVENEFAKIKLRHVAPNSAKPDKQENVETVDDKPPVSNPAVNAIKHENVFSRPRAATPPPPPPSLHRPAMPLPGSGESKTNTNQAPKVGIRGASGNSIRRPDSPNPETGRAEGKKERGIDNDDAMANENPFAIYKKEAVPANEDRIRNH